MEQFPELWGKILSEEFSKEYFIELQNFVNIERNTHNVYPPEGETYNAFRYTAPEDLKVIIMGQDPYHNVGQAEGLAFSVPDNIKPPPSLRNIMKELENNLGIKNENRNSLHQWAKEGVLLLNATLTVREGKAGSHQKKGWEEFTDNVIKKISRQFDGLIFLLWGKYAWNKESLIDCNKHHVLKSTHPSPLSAYRGFFGCQHFLEVNKLLKAQGKKEINWQL